MHIEDFYKRSSKSQHSSASFVLHICDVGFFSSVIFPLPQIIQGGFPGNSIKGQIWLKENFPINDANSKQRILFQKNVITLSQTAVFCSSYLLII